MRAPTPTLPGRRSRRRSARPFRAFTLIELLVVITIIGLMAAIAVPAFRGFGQTNTIGAAQRQLQDDLAFTRLQAIKQRAPVYMVFLMPPFGTDPAAFAMKMAEAHDQLSALPVTTEFDRQFRESALRVYTNTFPLQHGAYALFTAASLGEQPGVRRQRYLTAWRPLPEGAIFPTNGMQLRLPYWINGVSNRVVYTNLPARTVPFPLLPDRVNDLNLPLLDLPAIAFDAQGRLYSFKNDGTPDPSGPVLRDRFVAVGLGSVRFNRLPVDGSGATNVYDFFAPPDVLETPRANYTNHVIRVSALTGRAKLQKQPAP